MASLEECDEPEIATETLYTQDSETVCVICNAEFLDPQDLQLHLEQIHQGLVYCKFCASSAIDLLEYAHHIVNRHLKSLKSCVYCSKIFIDYDQHRKHERRHYCAKKDRHTCSQCPVIFEDSFELERHEYEEHNNDVDGFMMHDFFPILSSVLNMKAVHFIQSMNAGLPCDCRQCGYSTADVDSYIQHLRKHKCISLSCDNCSTPYKFKRDIVRHLGRHKECLNFVSTKTRECPECHEQISSRFYYNHTKQCTPIKCGGCDIVFHTMDELSDHQNKEHPFSIEVKFCKFCSRQCVGAYALVRHMVRVHKQEVHLYKYKCIECDTPFKHPQKLFAHYYKKHSSLEPYTCKICDKKFRMRRKFTIHIKLDHKSIGFVEFDEKYRVFFDDKKSPNPFVPKCVLPENELRMFNDHKDIRKKIKIQIDPKKDVGEKLNLDLLSQTETGGNEAENEAELGSKKSINRKRKLRKLPIKTRTPPQAIDIISIDSSDDDDEDVPLVNLMKNNPKQEKTPFRAVWDRRKKSMKDNRQQLTCKICKKYCYTYQNFQHHMSLHRKNVVKVCIKCSKDFKSKNELNKHIETEHSSSKLTETLKSLLEKRKKSQVAEPAEMTQSERFQQTVKRSVLDLVEPSATVTQLSNGLSVKKYLETFTPEEDTVKPTSNVIIQDSISIRTVPDPLYRKPVINLIKFEPKPTADQARLKLPVKFKPGVNEEVNIQVRLIQNDCANEMFEDDQDIYFDKDETIPEVAQEVMLENSEEPQRTVDLSSEVMHPDISIAHLQSEAPYYKIVKLNQLNAEPEKPQETISKDLIRLPDGTRLITVNPLAHLLGDKNVEDILPSTKYKYYKPKITNNVENMLTKALEKAKTPTNVRKKIKARARKLNILNQIEPFRD